MSKFFLLLSAFVLAVFSIPQGAPPTAEGMKHDLTTAGMSESAAEGLVKTMSDFFTSHKPAEGQQIDFKTAIPEMFSQIGTFMESQSAEDQEAFKKFMESKKAEFGAHFLVSLLLINSF